MAERMRTLAKRSGSKMSISKGSVNHIGTTPFKYKIDVFISYVDVVKTAGEVCVTWERRGKSEATTPVKVKDKKAVFRETLSMETTLFRKAPPGGKSSAPPSDGEELKFDEKIAKFALRKGGPSGKAIGKMHLNLADHIKGTTGTVFADLKLSNGSIVVSKIDATLLHMGKKKKSGSNAGSEMTDMTEMDMGMENDSIFGDDDQDHGDLEIMIEEAGEGRSSKMDKESPKAASSTQSDTPKSQKSSAKKDPISDPVTGKVAAKATLKEKVKAEENSGLAQSQSLRDKMKSKLKKDKESSKGSKKDTEDAASRKKDTAKTDAQVADLKATIAGLQNESAKLKTAKQAMMREIDELRSELESSEAALEEAQEELGNGGNTSPRNSQPEDKKLKEENKALKAQVRDLEGQIEGLLEELDGKEEEEEEEQTVVCNDKGGEEAKKYKRKIEDLEVALKREPQYLDVVDELKVTKMALALANMEKEQAIFALKQYETNAKQSSSAEDATSPVSQLDDIQRESSASTSSGWF